MIAFGAYRVDRREGRVWCDDREVVLGPKASALLLYLLERPGVLAHGFEAHAVR